MIFIPADEANSGVSELVVFDENYALLCNTIADIVDPLMKYFLGENLFATDEIKQITNITSVSDKIRMLLLNITSSLNMNNTRGFYMMLKTMKEYGGKGTLSLADHIMNRLKVSTEKSFHLQPVYSDTVVQNDDPKS